MAQESAADRKTRAGRIIRKLANAYPDADCALRHQNAFQLLIATILSAQCTDAMVNRVTAELFPKYLTPESLAEAEPTEIEQLIHRTGFYRQKTKSIQSTARDLCENFGGEVPRTLDELVTLRGVARKTANVVLGNCFGVPGLAVDTHMKRVNRHLGLTREDDPVKIERDLMALIPEKEWTVYSHRIITHGRECCVAKRPQCEGCPLREECPQ
ncbi:MAG: endonuclease III [bacterium]|nr:endonuclease III [bacterium]MCP5071448.1 endonuclease III [bacterium]